MTDQEFEQLIDHLRSADAYPHDCGEISVVQTHISCVILTGERAYKIKKPVTLGFLDFSSLEQRQQYCREELRLNRRFAPDVYLDIVPITGTLERPRVDGDGPVIEYAVCMRQFDQINLLSRMADEGRLHASHVDSMAKVIAEFHQSCAVAEADSPFLTTEAMTAPVRENFEALADLHEPWLTIVNALNVWTADQITAKQKHFESRASAGRIRECHGDMHLGNLFLDGDTVTPFDGVEFNKSFRWIDVANDLAFAVMDLEDRGYAAFAARLLNAWLEATGDYAALSVLPFYQVYRALVRAKVDSIRASQGDITRREQQHLSGDFGEYIDLALKYTHSQPRAVIITHGVSGSGKTFGTQSLVERFGAVRVRSDVERKRMRDDGALSTRDLYSSAATQQVYVQLKALAKDIIEAGYPAIVDATFLKAEPRRQLQALARQLNVTFFILDFAADVDACRQRIIDRGRRGGDASDATLDVLERQLKARELLDESEREFTVVIRDGASAADVLTERWLN